MKNIVYKAVGKTTKFSYIGGYSGTIEEAKSYNEVLASEGSIEQFHRSIRSLGADEYEYEVVDTAKDTKQLSKKVAAWIKKEGTDHGLNYKTTSVKSPKVRTRAPHSEETKQKMSEAKKGKSKGSLSRATRIKISKTKTGQKHSDETKRKIAAGRKGQKHSAATKQKISMKAKAQWEESRRAKAVQDLLASQSSSAPLSAPVAAKVMPEPTPIVEKAKTVPIPPPVSWGPPPSSAVKEKSIPVPPPISWGPPPKG